jgi:hypothetical protein
VASSGIKKVKILKADLPPVGNGNEYYLRYRIVSEDRNRSSHWSPVMIVESETLYPLSASINVSTPTMGPKNINIVWEDETKMYSKYDIFAKFTFDVVGRSISNNVATLTTSSSISSISVGSIITVSGVTATYNGTYTVTAVDKVAKTVSYAKIANNAAYTSTSGTITPGFLYHGTSSVHNYSLLAKDDPKTVEIAIQIEGFTKTLQSELQLYLSSSPIVL